MSDGITIQWEGLSASLPAGEKITSCTEDSVSKLEEALSMTLPKGYKEFCRVFGTGEFNRLTRIYCPCALNADKDIRYSGPFMLQSLKEAVEFERESHERGHPSIPLERISFLEKLLDSAVAFADTSRADTFLWDLESFNASDQSYDIYMVPFDSLDQSLRVGRDFREFVHNFCFSSKADEILPPELRFNEAPLTTTTFVPL